MCDLWQRVSRPEFRQDLQARMQQGAMARPKAEVLRSKFSKDSCAAAPTPTPQYQAMPDLRERFYFRGRTPRPVRSISKNIGGCMHINTIWQIEKNGSLAIAKSARSGPQNPGNASFAGKILWSQIAKIAEPTPARSADTAGNFRWSGRDTTRSAAHDPKRNRSISP